MRRSGFSRGLGARAALLLSLAGLLVAGGAGIGAQAPQSQPLVQAGNLVYLGKFTLPKIDGTGRDLIYGGAALGLGPDGQSLYYGCTDGSGRLARVTIPAIGGVGAIVEPCAAVPNLQAIKFDDTNGIKLGGSLSWNGRLITSAYVFYDGSGSAATSHFAGSGGVSSLTGPYRVGIDPPAMVGGYMGVVPSEWRGLFGGPALTGKCCTSIIWRSSYGPSISVFDPDHVGTQSLVPSTMLVGYPDAHQTLGAWDAVNPYYTGTQRVGGVAFPAGTRSVLFISRRGDSFCYGDGAHCNDPADPDKGTHGYPYRHVVTAYDANDLLAVKQGIRKPWEVLPYTQWTLTEMNNNGTADMTSAVYDPATRRWYVTAGFAGGAPVVHVYEITNAVLQPPPPRPKNLAATTRADGSLHFTWTPPDGAGWAHYRLEAGTSPGVSNVGTLLVPATATSLTLPVSGAGTFFVRIRAVFADGSSGMSNEIQLVLGGGGGGTPALSNFRASVAGADITLAWDPVTDPRVSDVLADVGTAAGLSNIVQGVSIGKAGTFVAAGVPAGRYFFRLRAIGPAGPGPSTNDVEVVVGGGGGATPYGPVDLAVTVGSQRSVAITWRYENEGPLPTRFIIEAGSQSGLADFGAVAVPLVTRFDVAGVPPGVYYVRVRGGNSAGVSPPSNEVRVVVP